MIWSGYSVVDVASGSGELPRDAVPAAELYDVLAKHRFTELDGLRGVASLMVGIGHTLGITAVGASSAGAGVAIALLTGVINGSLAVDLFFIMSGFFLAGMLENFKRRTIFAFYVRRLTRLVPPAVVSVIFLYIFVKLTIAGKPGNPLDGADLILFRSYNVTVPLKILLLNLVLIRHTLNPPLWTIRLEIFTSLLFPAVQYLNTRASSRWYSFGLFAVFLGIAVLLNRHQKLGLDVFHYLYIFYAGVLARDFGPCIADMTPRLQYALFGFAVLGLALTGEFVPPFQHPISFDLPVTVFGTILVVLLAYGKIPAIRNVMNGPAVQFFGRISYSFYLMSWLTIAGLGGLILRTDAISGHGITTILLAALPCCTFVGIGLAYLLHIAVEQPSVALSRYLGMKLK
jgi:peptidoglycan/LPS O-acetylase OafA/YrhL